MNAISSWSIRNPVPTIVLFLTLFFAGIIGFMQLRTNNMPDIEIPTVNVTISQPGAAPTEIETQVTRIVEDAVAGLGNIEHINSSVNEGVSTTTVSFLLGTNVDRATNDVRNAVSSIQAKLPLSAQQPVIERIDISGNAILTFSVDAPGLKPEPLSWYVDNDIAKALLSISGVAKIERVGGVDRQIRVRLQPDRIMALDLTAGSISQALASVNINQPAGRASIGGREQTVRTVSSASTVEQLMDVRVSVGDGRTVRLSDIAVIEDSWAEPRQRARLDGKEVIAFNVYRAAGSSEVDVAKAVRARVLKMNDAKGPAKITEISSSTAFVSESYEAAIESLWIGALLSVGVIWLFLRDIRATIVSAVALPLSLLPTFAVMRAFDISMNNVTLLAISLVVGILVDDAIVEIENIVRHMRQSGRTAYQAAIEAADEIGLAVVATTFTLVAVFVPVAFMPGIPGKFFTSFAIATCVSVLFSLLVARMLTPLLGAYFLKAGGHVESQPAWVTSYLWLLARALTYRWTTVTLGIVFFAGSMALATLLPTEFINAADRGRSVLSVKLPPGSTLDQTDAVVLQITKILKSRPEVVSVFAAEGTQTSSARPGSSSAAAEVRTATITANLIARNKRDLSQQAFEKAVGPSLDQIPGAQIQFGADGQSGAKVSVTLVSDDPEALSAATQDVERDMRTVNGFVNAASKANLAKPELVIMPDTAKAAELGVTASAIATTVNIATLGDSDQYLPKFNLAGRRISILVSLDERARNDPALIGNLPVAVGGGGAVPLQAVADIAFGSGPNAISRMDRRRSATIEATLDRLTLGEANARVAALPAIRSLPPSVTLANSGDSERLQQLISGFALAIGSGIVLMYFTLVLLFGGFIQPITILVALPLSVGGALGSLWLCGYALSLFPLIGLLMLMGIAAKNSILLVEYAIVAIGDHGLERGKALMDAAAKRARPIVMTSIAMGAGMLPIAIGYGADSESRAPMAIAIIGGLISSTVLSLVYVPVIFCVMDDLERRFGIVLRPMVNRREPSAAT